MSKRLKVLFCGTGWLDAVPIFARAIAHEGVSADVVTRDDRPLVAQLADVDVVLPSNALFGAAEFEAAASLRLVQQPAVGHEGIDLHAARARGVPVCNAPGVNAAAVGEAALFLLLGLARKYPIARRQFERAIVGSPAGTELGGRTLVIVGVGRTGSHLAKLAEGLGMKVIGLRSSDGRTGLLRALAAADAVSIHAPLTPETRNLFDDEAFAALPRGALVVNVSRGALIDRAALERALERGHLGGVGLDVFWQEPWDPNDPLYQRDDVLVLPHVAGSTIPSFERIGAVIGRNVAAIATGGELAHRIA